MEKQITLGGMTLIGERAETCRGCGLTHEHVEAGGIWHCPNPLCRICGASWIANKLKSVRSIPGTNKFEVDEAELLAAQRSHVKALTDEPLLAFLWATYPIWMADTFDQPWTKYTEDRDLGDEASP